MPRPSSSSTLHPPASHTPCLAPHCPPPPPCSHHAAHRPDTSSHLEFDLGNLAAFDPSPLNPEDFTPLNRNAKCLEVATAMAQALVSQLFVLPSEAVQGGRLAQLPPPSTALPREKSIPKPKPLTKWQKFAQVGVALLLGIWCWSGRVGWGGEWSGVGA
jgi:hypothetical protein